MSKRSVTPSRPIYPSPAALITSIDEGGKPNIITLGEVFNISIFKPVIVGIAIAKPRYSHELISKSCEYVVNLPTAAIVKEVDACGMCTGRETDKFATFGLTPLPAQKVEPPLIAECPVNIECRVIGIQEIGDHDLFLGEVVAQHVDESALDEKGKVQIDKLDALCYMRGQYWSTGSFIATHGYSNRSD